MSTSEEEGTTVTLHLVSGNPEHVCSYADLEKQGWVMKASASQKGAIIRSSEALAALPEELIEKIKHAVLVADIPATHKFIDQIRQHNAALATSLEELVEDFRFEILYDLFKNIR